MIMGIAKRLEDYLDHNGVQREVVQHRPTYGAMATAQAAHVPGDKLAKAVLLHDRDGKDYVLAVVPSTHRVEVDTLQEELGRPLALATEDELMRVFPDCDRGSVPPLGTAYGVFTVVDDSVTRLSDVYFDGGDHTDLVHMKTEDFRRVLPDARYGRFSHHV